MTSIQIKEINGYGPYLYSVEYDDDGQQQWEYLGHIDDVDIDSDIV